MYYITFFQSKAQYYILSKQRVEKTFNTAYLKHYRFKKKYITLNTAIY